MGEYLLLKHTNRLSVKIILLHIVFYIQYPSIVIGWSIIIRATQGLMEPIIERASVKSKFVLTRIFVPYVPLIWILEIGHTHVTTLYIYNLYEMINSQHLWFIESWTILDQIRKGKNDILNSRNMDFFVHSAGEAVYLFERSSVLAKVLAIISRFRCNRKSFKSVLNDS